MARRRARDDEGKFLADDPATPDVNEAYEPMAEPMADAEDTEPVAAVEPEQRRKAVPTEIRTPAGTVKIHQAAPRLNGADLLAYCHGELDGAVTEDEADQAVQIAHKSLEAYVGGAIPEKPAPVEQSAILQCAVHLLLMGWNQPGRILREREIPAVSRAAVTYRLIGRPRPALYNPGRIGGPVRGVTRLTR